MKFQAQSSSIANSEQKSASNQDAVLVDQKLGLFIVCDGMGGHASGDIAAQLAARAVQEFVARHQQDFLRYAQSTSVGTEPIDLVRSAIQNACERVFAEAQKNTAQGGMGCTLTMAVLVGKTAVMGHVGDSRLYLLRRGEAHQLSRDHTVVQELVDRGAMEFEAASASPYAHVLSRAVGVQESVQVDTLRFDVLPGDQLVICSDGFTDAFDKAHEIEVLVAAGDAPTIAERLANAARRRGSSDDISVLVVNILSSPDEQLSEQAHADEALLKLATLRKVSLFQGLAMQDLARIVDRCFVVVRAQGEELFREGETGNTLCIILEGKLEVRKRGQRLAELAEGNHAGEMALLCDTPRSASVHAIERSRLLLLSKQEFLAAIQEEPVTGAKLLLKLAQELSTRLAAMNDLL